MDRIEHVHRFTRAVSVGNPREFLQAEKEDLALRLHCIGILEFLSIDDMGLKILPPKSGEIPLENLEIIIRRYENRSSRT